MRNRNDCHRITSKLVKAHGAIAVEDLRIRTMARSAKGTPGEPGNNIAAKSDRNRSKLEKTWGIISQLRYKTAWARIKLAEVNPRNASRTRSRGGKVAKKTTEAYRTFRCGSCGLTLDRDHKAVLNMLTQAIGPEAQGGNAPAAQKGREQQI